MAEAVTAMSIKAHPTAGRPRSEEANTAILKAANVLLESTCYKELSMESIAERAGVGKPAIYRRWKTKAFATHLSRRRPEVDTGSFAGDLRVMLTNLADRIEYAMEGKVPRGLISEANLDEVSAHAFQCFVENRRSKIRALGDAISGAIIYRYLVRRERLDQAFIHSHIDFVLRASRMQK
jgi:AcrR family transcriptional regulator